METPRHTSDAHLRVHRSICRSDARGMAYRDRRRRHTPARTDGGALRHRRVRDRHYPRLRDRFLLRDWESARLRSARLEHARLQMELECLGREVDPHFLFNNLNALAHLVDQRSDAAPGFIRTLSATYRYVLDCRGRTLVPLAEELLALERHRALAEIRYGTAFSLDAQVPPDAAHRFLLPPVSLPEVFQNALKHNTVASDRPLRIVVRLEGETLVVENNLRPGPAPSRRAGIGLTNMRDRFRIATGRAIVWSVAQDRFVVRLPLVGASH